MQPLFWSAGLGSAFQHPPSAESTRSTNARRARRAVENGQYKKAIQSLSSAGFAPPSEDVLDEMVAKHPQSGASPFSFDEAPPPVQVAIVDVVNALRSFPSGTAPGQSCLRANHVKEAVFCSSPESAESALEGLVGVVNLLCAGRAPPAILPYLCGATLLACNKKNGGLRPIAVGEVLRRLISKCVSCAVHTDAIEVLSPLQVGVGIPVGCESIVHSVVSLQEDFSCPLPDWSCLKASLPSSLGGLNLRRAALHAPAAYISSLHRSEPLISDILGHSPSPPALLPSCVRALGMAASMPDWSSLQNIDVPLHQRTLSRLIDEASFDFLIESAPGALSSALPHAGDWLNVVPSSALGLHLLDQEFRPCLQYWLGLPIFAEGVRCPVCWSVADPFGDHHVGCGGNGDRIHRHNSIRDAIFSAAQTAALAPRKEFPSLVPCSQSRPADIFLPNWERDRPAALDVSVISTLQRLTLSGAASVQGHALRVGEERKMALHAASCRAVGVSFVPLLVESLGGWSDLAAKTLSSIGRLLGQRLGIPPLETTHHLFQRCAISLWRGNATLWLHRCPTPPPHIDSII
jgi:hypothetical protein